jgi:hypothetical protein
MRRQCTKTKGMSIYSHLEEMDLKDVLEVWLKGKTLHF